MTVHVPSQLRSYTVQQAEVTAEGSTLAEVLAALDGRFPGLRFRIITEQDTIRPHIKLYVNERQAAHLHVPVQPNDHIHIICALSGG